MNRKQTLRFDEQNKYTILMDLKGNLIIILMAFVIGFCSSYVYNHMIVTPQYTTSTVLAVSTRNLSSASARMANLMSSKNMAEVIKELFGSSILLDKLEERDKVKMTPASHISAEVLGETNLVKLTVKTETPEQSYRLINEILECYPEIAERVFENMTVEIIQKPQIPVRDSGNGIDARKRLLFTFMMGMLAAGIVVLFSIFRPTVKNELTAERYLNIDSLGTVPHEEKNKTLGMKLRKANKAVLVTNPTAGFAFTESYQKIASKLEYEKRKSGVSTILFTSVAENEGKSSNVVNIAYKLIEHRQSVAIIDCDFRKPAMHRLFEEEKEQVYDIAQYLKGSSAGRSMTGDLGRLFYPVVEGQLDVVYNVGRLQHVTEQVRSEAFARLIAHAKAHYDFVLLDCPPLGASMGAVVIGDYADASIMIVRQDYARIVDINDALEEISQTNAKPLGYIFNDYQDIAANRKAGHRHYGYGQYAKYARAAKKAAKKEHKAEKNAGRKSGRKAQIRPEEQIESRTSRRGRSQAQPEERSENADFSPFANSANNTNNEETGRSHRRSRRK